MTADELQRIAVRLSNQCWCRHWLNFFDTHASIDMAIHCTDYDRKPLQIGELLAKGFRRQDALGLRGVYLIKRTNEDGTPFESKIF